MKNILFALLLIWAHYSNAQVNLVPNSSFEETDSCPSSAGQISLSRSWGTMIMGGGDPDLHHVCALASCYCGVPTGAGNGYQFPKTGNAFSGLMTFYGANLREYIQGILSDTLIQGHEYCVSFYVNLRNNSKFYCNTIGAYFDNGSVSSATLFGVAQGNPQINNFSIQLNDTLQWIKIEGYFTANGTERYITIGNFFDDVSSDTAIFNINNLTPYAYYNIDDVSVIDISTLAFAGNDTIITAGDSIYLGRLSEIGLDEACVWFLDGMPIDTVAGIWVAPDSNTTYILQQTICGNVQYDTVTVTMDTGTGISSIDKVYNFEIYPNPNDGNMNISYTLKKEEKAKLIIYDIVGKELAAHQLTHEQNNLSISEAALKNGVYFFSLIVEEKLVGVKKVVIVK